jgi:hypothetical protein
LYSTETNEHKKILNLSVPVDEGILMMDVVGSGDDYFLFLSQNRIILLNLNTFQITYTETYSNVSKLFREGTYVSFCEGNNFVVLDLNLNVIYTQSINISGYEPMTTFGLSIFDSSKAAIYAMGSDNYGWSNSISFKDYIN